jgi:hypothetical protein
MLGGEWLMQLKVRDKAEAADEESISREKRVDILMTLWAASEKIEMKIMVICAVIIGLKFLKLELSDGSLLPVKVSALDKTVLCGTLGWIGFFLLLKTAGLVEMYNRVREGLGDEKEKLFPTMTPPLKWLVVFGGLVIGIAGVLVMPDMVAVALKIIGYVVDAVVSAVKDWLEDLIGLLRRVVGKV